MAPTAESRKMQMNAQTQFQVDVKMNFLHFDRIKKS